MTDTPTTTLTTPEAPRAAPDGADEVRVTWAAGAIWLTALIGTASKILGVMVVPGLRGVASARAIEWAEIASGALAYVLTALLVALVCTGSFELARARQVGVVRRALVVGLTGLTVALASPALVTRLHTVAALGLAVVSSFVAIVCGTRASAAPRTRALGAVLVVLATAALLRVVGWESAVIGGEHANMSLFQLGRGLVTGAVALEAIAVLLAVVWIALAGGLRGRILGNVAMLGAAVITYLAARGSDDVTGEVLRNALLPLVTMPEPYALVPVAAFQISATVLLAAVALTVAPRATKPGATLSRLVPASLALVLLSRGAFDVPLQALAAIAGGVWAVLATSEGERPTDQRSGVQQPMSEY